MKDLFSNVLKIVLILSLAVLSYYFVHIVVNKISSDDTKEKQVIEKHYIEQSSE